jgi:hypothetical protein
VKVVFGEVPPMRGGKQTATDSGGYGIFARLSVWCPTPAQ